jgi:tetratricopeptide (TPR) repeat protein
MAGATGDAVLVTRAQIANGRALLRVSRYPEGEAICRAAMAALAARPDATRADQADARRCMIEALIPLGKQSEARAMLESTLTEAREMAGPEHPSVADLETSLAGFVRESGKVDEARAMVERGLQLRERALGPDHIRVAESLASLADYEKDPAKKQAMLDRALAIAEDPVKGGLRGNTVAAQIHRRFALAAGAKNDNAGTKLHFERERALIEELAGADSLEMAVLMVNYGQYMTRWDFDGGVAMLQRAAELLDRHKDPRAAIARGGLALILANAERWSEALPILERIVAEADPDRIPPENLGQMRYHLARALIATHGDRDRAAQITEQAAADFKRAGPDGVELLDGLEHWRKKQKFN